MECNVVTRASLWLAIFIMMLYRYTDTNTTYTSYDSLFNQTDGSEIKTEVIASMKVSKALGVCAIIIHVLLVIPILIYVCNGSTVRQGTISNIVLDTLLAWTLLIQVAVTGADISLYSTSSVTYALVGLDLGISFCVVIFQSIVRNTNLEYFPPHLEKGQDGTVTLSKQFMEEEEEEA